MSHDNMGCTRLFQDFAFDFYRAGGSIALLRISGAASGEVANAMNAFAVSGSFETVRTPRPKRPYSIRSGGNGPRYSVPANGWITLVCWRPISTSPAAT